MDGQQQQRNEGWVARNAVALVMLCLTAIGWGVTWGALSERVAAFAPIVADVRSDIRALDNDLDALVVSVARVDGRAGYAAEELARVRQQVDILLRYLGPPSGTPPTYQRGVPPEPTLLDTAGPEN